MWKRCQGILKKFHHIQSTHVFHLRNWSWFALELVEIWDPKKNPTVSPIWGSWKVSPFSTFKGRPKPLNRNSFSRLSTSRMDGFPPRMDVLGSDYDWCLPMVPMISDVSKTSLRNRIGLTEALINSNKLLEVSRGWFWIWHYLWWKDLQNIQQPCQ